MDENRKLDANSALMDLDKGLRSPKVGQQCKAIVNFPELFERFPFPILINSAFLKLGDVFRTGNNFLRLCILRVTQQSEMHLDKIFSVEELKDRVYAVVHSNDPYARAITLRMLGSLACILSEDKSVHHNVLQGLDSNDHTEQEAAIFATVQFASHSKSFAKGICNKIAAMLEGLHAPLEIKLKLVPVLRHMHYNVQIFTKARTVLKELLPTYPAQEFVLVTLHTLTNLSLHSVVDIPAQVQLLLQYVRCDPREAIKSLALKDLNVLAHRTPHLWSSSDVDDLCKAYTVVGIQSHIKGHIMSILCTLSSTSTVLQLNLSQDSELMKLCYQCANSADIPQAIYGTRLMCLLMAHITRAHSSAQQSHDLQKQAAPCLENLLLLLVSSGTYSEQDRHLLRVLLPAVSETCAVVEADICNTLTSSIVHLLTTYCDPNDDISIMLCETLASVFMTSESKIKTESIAQDLFQMLQDVASLNDDSVNVQKLIVLLCTLLLLVNAPIRDSSLSRKIYDILTHSNANKWSWYRVARQAARFGEHSLASKIFSLLSSEVAMERYYFWLNALNEFTEAESILLTIFDGVYDSNKCDKGLIEATKKYQNGTTSLKCSVSPDHPLHFQCSYANLRCRTLLAHFSLFQTCQRLSTSPPPATATTANEKSAGLVHWLRKCCEEFREIAHKYNQLHLVSFDADDATLTNIDICQQSCIVMTQLIESVALNRGYNAETMVVMDDANNKNLQMKPSSHFIKTMKQTFDEIYKIAADISKKDDAANPLSSKHTECLISCACKLIKVPFAFPRYFFQSLQTTTIKLAISPPMRSPNDPVLVHSNQRLTLKIEGVIRYDGSAEFNKSSTNRGRKERIFRQVAKVKVRVTSTCIQPANHHQSVKVDAGVDMTNTVEPHNNYFSTQFLVHLPVLGNHNVTVDASVIDSSDMCWKFGSKETLLARSFDDNVKPHHKPSNSQSRSNH